MADIPLWEMSLNLVRPDHFEFRHPIRQRLETIGNIAAYAEARPTKEDWEAHYYHLRNEIYFNPMVKAFANRDTAIILLTGENIIERGRALIGLHYDPRKLLPGTIRRDFCNIEEFEKTLREEGYCSNVIHGSSSLSEAMREYDVWEKYLIKNELLN